MKVIIIEDEEILSEVLKEKLEKAQIEVGTAMDGEAALEMVKKTLPNLILLDLILPKKSGFDVLGEIKSNSKLKDIPVIVLSNLGEDEEIKTALKMGAADYLVKTQHPINEVVEKVKKFLIAGKVV